MSGRIVPEFNMPQIREVMEGPYRIIYHIGADRIEVLTVLHSSQDMQTMLSGED
jgi:plasmid stabilization system protein ParE